LAWVAGAAVAIILLQSAVKEDKLAIS